jgi:hypothetical protein
MDASSTSAFVVSMLRALLFSINVGRLASPITHVPCMQTDKENNRVRRVSIATGTVTTLAGDGTQGCVDGFGTSAQFSSPVDLAVNAAGSFAVVVRNNDRGCERDMDRRHLSQSRAGRLW